MARQHLWHRSRPITSHRHYTGCGSIVLTMLPVRPSMADTKWLPLEEPGMYVCNCVCSFSLNYFWHITKITILKFKTTSKTFGHGLHKIYDTCFTKSTTDILHIPECYIKNITQLLVILVMQIVIYQYLCKAVLPCTKTTLLCA